MQTISCILFYGSFLSYRCNVKSSPRVPVKWMLPLLLQHLQFLWQPVNGKEGSVREPIDMSLFLVHPAGWTKKTDSIPPSTNSLHFHLLAAEHDRLAKHTVTWATWTLFHDSQEFWAILSSWGGHSRSEITGSDGKHHPLSLLPHLSPFLFLIFYTLPPCCFSFSLGSRTVLFSLLFSCDFEACIITTRALGFLLFIVFIQWWCSLCWLCLVTCYSQVLYSLCFLNFIKILIK